MYQTHLLTHIQLGCTFNSSRFNNSIEHGHNWFMWWSGAYLPTWWLVGNRTLKDSVTFWYQNIQHFVRKTHFWNVAPDLHKNITKNVHVIFMLQMLRNYFPHMQLIVPSCRVFIEWHLFRYMALLKPIKYNKVGIIKNICDQQWFQCHFVNQSSVASWPMGSGDIPENPEFWSRIWPIYRVKQRKKACVKK